MIVQNVLNSDDLYHASLKNECAIKKKKGGGGEGMDLFRAWR